jgi:hypothetical protein
MEKASHAEIAKRAYAIWESEGRPHGRDFDHWLAAEREVAGMAPAEMPPSEEPAPEAAATIKRRPQRPSTRKKTPS